MIQNHQIGIRIYKKKIVLSLFLRCGCGKYKSDRYRGVVCEKCGMEVKSETKIDIPREILNYYLGFGKQSSGLCPQGACVGGFSCPHGNISNDSFVQRMEEEKLSPPEERLLE